MIKVLIGMVIIGLLSLVGCTKNIQEISGPDETLTDKTERDERKEQESDTADLNESEEHDSEGGRSNSRVFSDDDDTKYSNRVKSSAGNEEDEPEKTDEKEFDAREEEGPILQKVSIDNLSGSLSELEILLSQQGITIPGKQYVDQFSSVTDLINADNPEDALTEIEDLLSSQGIRIPREYAQYGDMLNMDDPDWAITNDGFIGAYMGSDLDAVIPSRINGIDVKGVLNVVSSGDAEGMSGLVEQLR